jgi:hypothetical protein
VGDQLAVEKVTKRLETFYRNEVVVFNPPQTFRYYFHMRQYLKEGAHQARSSGRRRSRSQGRKAYINGEGQDEEDFIAELQNISLDLW